MHYDKTVLWLYLCAFCHSVLAVSVGYWFKAFGVDWHPYSYRQQLYRRKIMRLEQSASSSTYTSSVSDRNLVFGVDSFILIIIFVFFVFNIPRTLVYTANKRSQTFQGYLLRSTRQLRTHRSPSQMTLEQSTDVEKGSLESSVPANKPERQPWHLPMHFSLRHPAASFAQYRVIENYTVMQVLLMAGYTGTIFYAAFYASNPFSDPGRAGLVVASQIPFVYAFATKNNVIGLLVGVGYEKLNYLHRHVGRLMVIGANVHAIGNIYMWTLTGDISKKIAEPYIRWGIVALVCFDLLGLFSVHYVRMKYYNLFFGTHTVALVVALIAVCNHKHASIPYVVAGAVVYGLDHILRVIKTRFTTAILRTIPELGLTQLDIPSLNTGWRPGQHVRLRVLSTAMGPWGMIEVHPFTIASATDTEEGLVLMCKRTGNWTTKLYKMAQTPATNGQPGKRAQVLVQGPYGGIGDTMVPNYSGAMFVVGGSGVTFALSAVQDLVLAGAQSRTHIINVIWSVPDPAALKSFLPLFSALVSQRGPARLEVSVFYTRATIRSVEELVLPRGVALVCGRPKMEKLLDAFITSVINEGGTHGAFVGVCGPVALAKDVAYSTRTLDGRSKRAVGGIQFHEEVFGW